MPSKSEFHGHLLSMTAENPGEVPMKLFVYDVLGKNAVAEYEVATEEEPFRFLYYGHWYEVEIGDRRLDVSPVHGERQRSARRIEKALNHALRKGVSDNSNS